MKNEGKHVHYNELAYYQCIVPTIRRRSDNKEKFKTVNYSVHTYAVQAAVLCGSRYFCRRKAAVVLREVAEGL